MTVKEFFEKNDITFVKLDELKSVDPANTIRLMDAEIDSLANFFKNTFNEFDNKWSSWNEKELTEQLADVLRDPTSNNGKVYETLVYDWLRRIYPCYKPQVDIAVEDCYKKNETGYPADGEVDGVMFDVKSFGIGFPLLYKAQERIQKEVDKQTKPFQYIVMLEGSRNEYTKDIEKEIIAKAPDIVKDLLKKEHLTHHRYIKKIPEYDLTIRADEITRPGVFFGEGHYDPYLWAEKNQFYFLGHCSQFCVNEPYMIICPFDGYLAPLFCGDDRNDNCSSAAISFRALARRMFINLTHMDDKYITEFDDKARDNVTVAEVSRKLSAIVFMDVSKKLEWPASIWCYVNPNADHKMPGYVIDELFRNEGALIEDFRYDNY